MKKASEQPTKAASRPNPEALDAAREFVRDRIRRSSVRRVAAESGISKNVIAQFADAATTPHPRNAQALVEYHLQSAPKGLGEAEERLNATWRPDPVQVDAAREFVIARLRRLSIRRVAAEAGLSRGVIEKFANGTTPHPANAQFLVEYHLKFGPEEPAEADATPGIPIEKLREFYSEEYRRVRSLRRVARAAGVSLGALEGFLDRAKATHPGIRHKLAAHYLARDGRLSEPKSRPSSADAAEPRPAGAGGAGESDGPEPWALEEAREFIRSRVKASSPGRVAKEVGPPVTGKVIDGFTAGSEPLPANTQALIAFYDRTRSSGLPDVADDTDNAIELEAVRELLRFIEQREPLRIISEQSGVTTATLANFSRGSTPIPENRHRLLRWYNSLPPEARVVPPAPDRPVEGEEPAVDFVRQLVAQRHEQIGMYLLGDELGVSTTPVRDFIAGSPPTHRTWEKLLAWYRVREAAGLAVLHRKVSKEIRFQPRRDTPYRAAMGILMDAFPERDRRAVRRRVLEVMAEEHQNGGRDLPEWIKDLLKQRAAAPGAPAT